MAKKFNLVKLTVADLAAMAQACGLIAEDTAVEGVFLGKSHNSIQADMKYAVPFNREYEYVLIATKPREVIPVPGNVSISQQDPDDEDRMII